MKPTKWIFAALAALTLAFGTAARADIVSISATDGSNSLNLTLQVDNLTNTIQSATGSVTEVTLGTLALGNLMSTALAPVGQYGQYFYFDNLWGAPAGIGGATGFSDPGLGVFSLLGAFQMNFYDDVGNGNAFTMNIHNGQSYHSHAFRTVDIQTMPDGKVPEPASLALVALALTGAGLSRRKTNTKGIAPVPA